MRMNEAEKGMIPASPFLATAGIGLISGLFGPISIGIGLVEVLVGYHMYKNQKKPIGTAVFSGGLIAMFMGIGESVWGSMSATGNTTTASLEGWKKIMFPSAYGYEMIAKAFSPKMPSFNPTPESVVKTGVRTVW